MKVKKTSEKVLSTLYWLVFGFLTVRWLLLGKIDILTMILLAVAYFYIILKCVTCVLNLILKREDYKLNKECKQLFEQLKTMHKARYKAYFSKMMKKLRICQKALKVRANYLSQLAKNVSKMEN